MDFTSFTPPGAGALPLRRRTARAGFSLAEVAITIGIMAFVLVAIFSLTASSVQQIQSSEADSKVASVAQQAFFLAKSELSREADFLSPPPPWSGAPPNAERHLYYDKEGRFVGDALTPESVFHARLILGPPPAGTGATAAPDALKSLVLRIEWPAQAAPGASRNVHTLSLLLHNSGKK
ncbi:hypothetical protein DB346_24015 [Verrucomicrobia bacterium LW23]|nr:hypothetical protein DB346_24015 [Verrucomicrobia bacterium LW23]